MMGSSLANEDSKYDVKKMKEKEGWWGEEKHNTKYMCNYEKI